MPKFMNISLMNTVKNSTLLSIDQLVSMKMEHAILQELIMDAEMSKLGNGPMQTTS
jgi:hypothetical protein